MNVLVNRFPLLALAVGLGVAALVVANGALRRDDGLDSWVDAPLERPAYDPDAARKTVEMWEQRTRTDPGGAIGFCELASAYLRLHRETGDIGDVVRAEKAARQSLRVRERGNTAARSRLAQALLAQHRFSEALEQADIAADADPDAQRIRADILLEIGDIVGAKHALGAVPTSEDDPNIHALHARIREARGDADGALRLRREAARVANELFDMPHEALAWYHTMVGHALIDSGRLEEGERSCRVALEFFPRDYRAVTGLAEAATARGDWGRAIELGNRALALAPQNPEVLRLLVEAHAQLGQAEESARFEQRLESLCHSFPRIYDRHWVLFCADHGRDLDEALELARKDLTLRPDALSFDTLAWVHHKRGEQAEADSTLREAMAREPQNVTILEHAVQIAEAGNDASRAAAFRAEANAVRAADRPC
jgi:tetratricopeptide (TPR) repeat protein